MNDMFAGILLLTSWIWLFANMFALLPTAKAISVFGWWALPVSLLAMVPALIHQIQMNTGIFMDSNEFERRMKEFGENIITGLGTITFCTFVIGLLYVLFS